MRSRPETLRRNTGFSFVDFLPAYYYLLEEQTNGGAGLPAGSYRATATNPQNSNCWVSAVAAFRVR
jgi:hypothetical protein